MTVNYFIYGSPDGGPVMYRPYKYLAVADEQYCTGEMEMKKRVEI